MTTTNKSDSKSVGDVNPSSPYSWKRPEGPPRIWRVVDGRKKTADGEIPRFSIQEVPKELEDDVFDFMTKYFLPEESICSNLGLAADPHAALELQTMWRNVLNQGVSVVALTVNSDPTAKPVIAGVNLLYVTTTEDKSDPLTEDMVSKMSAELNVMKIYDIDRYLGGLGLSVHPSLRGQGIGEELLRARDDIGLAYQIPVSETIFSGTVSQILAARVGFEVLLEKKYSEILDEEGKLVFPGVTVEYLKIMGKRLY